MYLRASHANDLVFGPSDLNLYFGRWRGVSTKQFNYYNLVECTVPTKDAVKKVLCAIYLLLRGVLQTVYVLGPKKIQLSVIQIAGSRGQN